jgi:hypothetical protein
MTRGDAVIERGANRLAELAERTSGQGGLKAKLADELATDAVFLRKLKPSLILARARGDRPFEPTPPAAKLEKPRHGGSEPNPFLVAAAALALGILVAKVVDWRGHAHPRD